MDWRGWAEIVFTIALTVAATATLTETLSAKPRPLFAPEATH